MSNEAWIEFLNTAKQGDLERFYTPEEAAQIIESRKTPQWQQECTQILKVKTNTIKRSERSIELDCPPGYPRPGDLIEGVIEGLGLPWPKETTNRSFGNWKWEWLEVDWKRWLEIQPVLKERIKKLLDQGTIRYGSW